MRMTPENFRRRWFQFSLRTLFVFVALLACWLSWELAEVRRRGTTLTQLREMGVVPVYRSESNSFRHRWLGDVDVATFEIPMRVFVEVHPTLIRLFPESDEAEFADLYNAKIRGTAKRD